jgi:hypothetical protein
MTPGALHQHLWEKAKPSVFVRLAALLFVEHGSVGHHSAICSQT